MTSYEIVRKRSIVFAEYIAKQHYILYDVSEGICYWRNENGVKTTDQLYKELENNK